MKTQTHRFGGFNIKATPRMRAEYVRHDLGVVRNHTDVAVLQEMKWDYYWTAMRRALNQRSSRWSTHPTLPIGAKHSVASAQPITWDRNAWRKCGQALNTRIHAGAAGISEDRYARAAPLADRLQSSLAMWAASSHFVVGGDKDNDGAGNYHQREALLRKDLEKFKQFIRELQTTEVEGQVLPIVFEGDLNINLHTWAYGVLMNHVHSLGGRIVGRHGIEYLLVFDAHSDVKVHVQDIFYVGTDRMYTDHEGRGMRFYLYKEEK